ncbi:MAG: pyridoxal phosphate-dependent aminotransferase, partial [Candidatus Eremiobacteraeota bacterium]|nr:pyridoxal phosphate-dependent aminotransferase [Candidatus Eremiobacteraeota bacterium]
MNPRVLEIEGSLIREVAAQRRPTTIDLGLGEPSLMPNPMHLECAMAYVMKHGIKYSQNAGDRDLRAAIAHHYAYPSLDRAENVCVTTGSQEAMYVAIKTLLDPDSDEMLVVEPAFPSYAKMARLEGIVARAVEMNDADDFGIDAERIIAALTPKTRAIVICSPNNPTGRVLHRDEAEKLVRALESRSGGPTWLVHDEIYREQTFVNDEAYLAQIYPHTIVTNSVSKSNALTGLRLGWIIGPEAFIDQAIKAHAWLTSCADTFAQQVALSIFRTKDGISEHAGWYAAQHAGVVDALSSSGMRYLRPEGSFYACVQLPRGTASLDGALALLARRDVLAIPGSAFGACFEGWLRLSWVAPIDRVREGVKRIAEYVSESACWPG